jgi:hypothetical protein
MDGSEVAAVADLARGADVLAVGCGTDSMNAGHRPGAATRSEGFVVVVAYTL